MDGLKVARMMGPRVKGVVTLKRELDDIFSKWVRLEAADSSGLVRCVTCGSVHDWQNLDNGHFIKRQWTLIRWEPKNCHPQCRNCNWHKQGNDAEYEKYIINKYGEAVLNWLRANAKKKKWTRFELEMLINHYKPLVKKLKRRIGCK